MDKRIVNTKERITDRFMKLLKTTALDKITVTQICRRANINRATFYKYYGSQFDLLTDMEKDILDFISKTIKHNETEPEKIMSSICNYLEENLEFVRLIINNNVDPMFAHKLLAMESIKESALNRFSASKSEAEVEYIYNFLTYGAFHMVCAWLNKEKRESPKMLAKLIVQMMLR